MPRGFIGNAAARYLGQAHTAHTNAVNVSRQAPEGVQRADSVGRPVVGSSLLAVPRERRFPFEPEDAFVGGFTVGRGNSSNIVANESEYAQVCQMIDNADDKMGECLYKVAMEIEAMCQTAFVLPTAVPRCMNISDSVKRMLSDFRTITYDIYAEARRFASAITGVGHKG